MYRMDRPWPGIWESLPDVFAGFRAEPTFDCGNSTFCMWRRNVDSIWQRAEVEYPDGNEDPDGSKDLLWMLDGQPGTYCTWAGEYYEREIPLAAVAAVYAHEPLTEALVGAFGTGASLKRLRADIAEIGYPEQD